MRILHVINHVGIRSGAAKVMMDLLLYQKSKGHIVDVVALFDIDLSYDMKEFGCGIRILFDSKNELYRYNPLAIIKLVPILSKYDIIHVHLFPSLYWVALARIISFSKSKLVYTEHCSVNNRQNIKMLIPLERFIYKQYDKIVSISDSVDEYLKKTIGCCGIIKKIYNGVNRELFIKSKPIPRIKLGLNEHDIVITQVARFNYQKDQITLIKSLFYLPGNCHVLFVGDGDLRKMNEDEVFKLGLSNRIHFLGIRTDVPSILKASDIVVVSSKFEGLCLSAIEGMASGKPVVASNVPGLYEIVNGAGLLFDFQDEIGLANHILSLLKDDVFYHDIALKCLRRSEEYDLIHMASRYMDLYERL